MGPLLESVTTRRGFKGFLAPLGFKLSHPLPTLGRLDSRLSFCGSPTASVGRGQGYGEPSWGPALAKGSGFRLRHSLPFSDSKALACRVPRSGMTKTHVPRLLVRPVVDHHLVKVDPSPPPLTLLQRLSSSSSRPPPSFSLFCCLLCGALF